MKKITQEEAARQLGLSRSTIVRCLRNDPAVKQKTRQRVVRFLNSNGFSRQNLNMQNTILVGSRGENVFQSNLVRHLENCLRIRQMHLIQADIEKDPAHFMELARRADTVVFGSLYDPRIMQKALDVNPDLYSINVLSDGTRATNISIETDNHVGGELAAHYLMDMGHRDILIVTVQNAPALAARQKSFEIEFRHFCPDSRVDIFGINAPAPAWQDQLYDFLRNRETIPTAVFCTGHTLQDSTVDVLKKLGLQVPADVSILSHDRPEDFLTDIKYPCDHIYYEMSEIFQIMEYFVVNRPLLPTGSHWTVAPELYIRQEGTVRKISLSDRRRNRR